VICAATTLFSKGFYDTQYADRAVPDCRGRLVTNKDGKYGFRAIVPVSYPVPGDVSVPCFLSSAFGLLNDFSLRPRASVRSSIG
jgi:protocatechuate 3,4-dioxygenase beta subunit